MWNAEVLSDERVNEDNVLPRAPSKARARTAWPDATAVSLQHVSAHRQNVHPGPGDDHRCSATSSDDSSTLPASIGRSRYPNSLRSRQDSVWTSGPWVDRKIRGPFSVNNRVAPRSTAPSAPS